MNASASNVAAAPTRLAELATELEHLALAANGSILNSAFGLSDLIKPNKG